jgi:SAM-dependent methyltransferase
MEERMNEEPIALEAYSQLADAYAARVDTKAHNALYDRPAVLSLLPPVEGLRVLDAGCGPGVYSEWLTDRGAEVVALDVCPRMVELARLRLGNRAVVHLADLGRRLDLFRPASFDLVVSPLALDYVRDWQAVFREFFRVLGASGVLIFSCHHPAADFYIYHPEGNYFDVEAVGFDWTGFGSPVRMPYYRRPLQEMIGPLLEAGFVLERLLEPRPVPEFEERDAFSYERLMRQPGFICFRARKPSDRE